MCYLEFMYEKNRHKGETTFWREKERKSTGNYACPHGVGQKKSTDKEVTAKNSKQARCGGVCL
jgi:hypothetical protein